jgi:hypothetical protein
MLVVLVLHRMQADQNVSTPAEFLTIAPHLFAQRADLGSGEPFK